MTIETIYQILKDNIDINKNLRIIENLADGTYDKILGFFYVNEILIKECSLKKGTNNITIIGRADIQGTFSFRGGKIEIITKQKDEGSLNCKVKIGLKGTYEIEKLIGITAPSLACDNKTEDSLFRGIYFENPVLEYNDEFYILELQTLGNISLENDKWGKYKELIDTEMSIKGTIVPNTLNYPIVKLILQLNNNVIFPIGIGMGKVVIETLDDPWKYETRQVSIAYIEYSISVEKLNKLLFFRMPLFIQRDVWQFSALSDPPIVIENMMFVLKDIFNLPDNMRLMPQGAFLNSFGLQQLDILYKPQTENTFDNMQMKHIRGIFALGKPLETFIPRLTLDQFQFAWEASWWSSPDAVATLFMAASASAEFGDLTLTGDVTAYYPYMEFTGNLTLSKESTLQELAQSSGVSLPDFWTSNAAETNEIASVDIRANAIQRDIALWFSISDVLKLRINKELSFNLEEITAELSYGSGQMSFVISGIVGFQGKGQENLFSMRMSAGYREGGWLFEGGLAHGEVDLGKFLYGVLGLDPSSLDKAVAGVQLQDFRISYSTTAEELLLYASCAVWFDILGIRTTLGGRVRLRQVEDKKEAALIAYVDIESLRLRVLAQVDNFYAENKTYVFRIELQNKYLQAVVDKGDPDKAATLTITLGGMTLGDIVLEVIRLLNPNARNTLPAPWDMLNKIDLSKFVLTINLTNNTMTFTYNIDFNLAGILKIHSVGIAYDGQKVDYVIKADILGQGTDIAWDALNGAPPEDVLPDEKSFKLNYFGLGNHLDFVLSGDTLAEMMEDMSKKLNPAAATQEVSYSEKGGWMIGVDLELTSLFQARMLLYDPKLYGIAVILNIQEKDQPPLSDLAGFAAELYYKKISDETGMFHCRMTLPRKFTVINLGAVTLYLGEILLEIYTNGSFYFDLGFPHNQDFSRSWGLSVGIYTGKGGVYFGIFKGDAVNSVPEILNGAFSPVVKIGIGLSFGLSKSFDIGIVKGGVSLMAVGMFEGIFAVFNRKENEKEKEERAVYYKVEAVVGVAGSLFICVDFKIIVVKASAMVSAFCTLQLESYRRALIQVELELMVKAYIKILFIKISFSFHLQQTVKFYLGSDSQTPWVLKEVPKTRSSLIKRQDIVFRTDRSGEEKVSILLQVMPLVSIRDARRANNLLPLYSMAFPVFLLKDDFGRLLDRIADLTWNADTEFLTEDYALSMLEGTMEESITYEKVLGFFQNHVQIQIEITTDSNGQDEEIPAVVFPMLPQLTLLVNDEETDFSKPLVDDNYISTISQYFSNTDADVTHRPDTKSVQENKELPICAVLLTDWFKLVVRELAGNVNALFESIEVECETIAEAKALYGIDERTLLEKNPNMRMKVNAIPEMQLTVAKGETLEQLAHKAGVMPLWRAAAKTYGLFINSFEVVMDSYIFHPVAHLTLKQVSAMFYIRLFDVDVIYSRYAESILKLNAGSAEEIPDLDMMWECETAGERVIRLPGIGDWTAYAGDSVERLAKMCAVLDSSYRDSRWEEFQRMVQAVETEQHGTEPGYRVCGVYNVKRFAGTLQELYRRFYPDFRNNPQDYPLWGQEILRPGTTLRTKDIQVQGLHNGAEVENTLQQYGSEAVLGGLRTGTAELSCRQRLLIYQPRRIPLSILKERLLSDETVAQIAAILSRAFLQGTKLPKIDGTGTLIPMYQITGQMIDLPGELTDYRMQLHCQAETGWINAQTDEKTITADVIRGWEFTQALQEVWKVQKTPSFEKSVQCYYLLEGWKTNLAETEKVYLGMLPEGASDYIQKYGELPEVDQKKNGAIHCVWTAALPVRLYRKEKGVYYVLGVKASDTDMLFGLTSSQSLSLAMFYNNKGSGAETESLIPLTGEDAAIVKTNLSKETHHVLTGTGKSYLAQLADGVEFIKLLWECTVIGGGYWFHLPKDEIADFVFDEEGFGEIMLVAEIGADALSFVNSLYLPAIPTDITLYGMKEEVFYPALPAGSVGFTVDRNFNNADTYQSLFQMMAYTVEESNGKTFESMPLLPTGKEEEDTVRYDFVCPLWKIYGLSPYDGLGEETRFRLYARDVLGNSDTIDNSQMKGDGLTVVSTYNDFLIGLHELPGTTWTYYFTKGSGGETTVKINAEFSPDRLPEGEERSAAVAYISTSQAQLACEDVSVEAACSLGPLSLPSNVLDTIRKYVSDLHKYLSDETKDIPSAEFDAAYHASENKDEGVSAVIPVELRLSVNRNENLDKEMVAAAVCAETKLIPSGSADFDKCWSESKLPYLLAYDSTDQPVAVAKTLLNLKGEETLFGISPFEIKLSDQNAVLSPEFYAVVPLSNELVTVEIEDNHYTFASQDANKWEKQFLEDMENFLSGPNVCKVLNCVKTSEEKEELDGKECLNRLIRVKEEIAEQLAQRVQGIRQGAIQAPAKVIDLAKDRFSQNLAWAYDTDVIAVYKAVWKNCADQAQYRLEPSVKSDSCISATKLESQVDGAGNDNGVFCMFLSETEEAIENMDLSFPYLEYDIGTGLEGYDRSKWLRLASPVTENISLKRDLGVPFPKKICPLPPQLLGQSNSSDEQELLKYQWSVEISTELLKQDTLYLQIEYGELSKGADEGKESKINALARYQLNRAQIMEMLQDEAKLLAAYNKFVAYAESYSNSQVTASVLPVLEHTETSVVIKIGYPSEQNAQAAILNLPDVAKHLEVDANDILCVVERQLEGNDKITVTIRSLPIYKYYWVKPKASLVRNENVFANQNVKVNDRFIFRTETMELSQIYISADYRSRFVISKSSFVEAVSAVLETLQITSYPVHLSMTIYYEYPMLPGRRDIMARLPVTFFPYFKTLGEIEELLKECVLPDKEGGKIILDANVYKDGTDIKVLHVGFDVYI